MLSLALSSKALISQNERFCEFCICPFNYCALHFKKGHYAFFNRFEELNFY